MWTVRWQATVLAAFALLVGIPVGIVAGRVLWTVVAERAGFPAEPVVPLAGLVALGVAVLVFAVLVASAPAWSARRSPPGRVLRAE